MSKHLSTALFCLFFLSAAIIIPGTSSGQLVAHTGGYLRWCRATTLNPGPHLGGGPSATGGVEPYHYQWTCLTFTPSASPWLPPLFDNDTIANPQVNLWEFSVYHSIDVLLTVTDAMGAVAHDTAHIHASGFAYAFDLCEWYKRVSDSVTLFPLIAGGTYGCPPYTYRWTPNLYLSNDTLAYPQCGAPVNMTYTLHFTDSLGCTDTGATPCNVHIRTDAASSIKNSIHDVSIYPVPLTENSIVSIPHEWIGSTIYFFSTDGRLINTMQLKDEATSLNGVRHSLPPGLLFYKIKGMNGEAVTSGKLVR